MIRTSRQLSSTLSRSFASVTNGQALTYSEYGSPLKVLKLDKHNPGEISSQGEVLVKMLAAPINPADINMIQGTYGKHPTFPAVGGNEGVGEIEDPGQSNFKKGDWVIPSGSGAGTWRTHRVCDATELIKVRGDIPVEYAASLLSNPSTAYRLLQDFVTLEKGDVIIQNAANSMVGVCVNQLAKSRGIEVINIVRSRENDSQTSQLREKLGSIGAKHIFTEEQLASHEYASLVKSLAAPKLAINLVGGKSATNIARTLDNGGTMVTIGGMSRQPILVPTGALIFKNLTFRGFWMTRWHEQNTIQDRTVMLNQLADLVKDGKLKLWFESAKLEDYEKAIERATGSHKDAKIIFKF